MKNFNLEKALSIISILYGLAVCSSMAAMEIGAVLWLVVFLVYAYQKKWTVCTMQPIMLPVSLYCCAAILSLFMSTYPVDLRHQLGPLRFYPLLFVMIWTFSQTKNYRHVFLGIFILSSIIAVYGIVQSYFGIDLIRPEGQKRIYGLSGYVAGETYRAIGTFNHPLTFACAYVLPSIFAFAFLAAKNKLRPKYRFLLFLCACLLLFALFRTHSKNIYLAIPISIAFVLFFERRKLSYVFLVAVAIVFASLYWSSPKFRTFYKINTDFTFIRSNIQRVMLWDANLELIKDNIWFGVGINNDDKSAEYLDKLYPNPDVQKLYGHAHNNILQILSEMGIFGLLAYLYFWIIIFLSLFKGYLKAKAQDHSFYRSILIGGLGAFIGFHCNGLTQSNFFDSEVTWGLFLYIGMCMAVAGQLNRKGNET